MEILFEDERLIVISKSRGELVVAGRNSSQEPLSQILSRLKGRAIDPVHRLDKETSGIVIFAKESATHRQLCGYFEHRQVQKTYHALVIGKMEGEGTIDLPLRLFGSGRMGVSKEGKKSLTRYRVLKSSPKASLIEAYPLTGRRHQIRVHFNAIGHSVMGDSLYGSSKTPNAPRLMLHALEIALPGKIWPAFRSEPPKDFLAFAENIFQNKTLD